ncbi:MAG: 2-dehydropantoate 2-reductase [Candidatus Pacebacteria bacterium]|nr:2-dehydropantoate 2-reductase [Candidatus Paceibacterota bacterium]
MKKILIYGAGSIGIYLGAMLKADDNDVYLFGRKKLTDTGDKILIDGTEYDTPKKLFELPFDETFDYIFISTKLYDLEEAFLSIKKHGLKCSILTSIQNGLVDNSKYTDIIPHQPFLVISVFEGFNIKDNKLTTRSTALGWKVDDTAAGKTISDLLLHAKISCRTEKNLDVIRAEKTIMNCCLNALSAMENMTFFELFRNNQTEEKISKLFDECYAVLSAYFSLDEKDVMKHRMYDVCSKMQHYSSLQQDLRSGRKTEIDFLNGYIIELGRKKNIPTPENQEIVTRFKHVLTP